MKEFDDYLAKLTNEYMSGCEPKIIESSCDPQDDGFEWSHTYNCEDCTEIDCEYWMGFHNETDLEEIIKDMEI